MRKFVIDMAPGDWVVVPSKYTPSINIAEIKGPYTYDPEAEDPYYHYRAVKWIKKDIPRSVFDQDLLYSFGAFSTVCEISRNDAEQRVREMAKCNFFKPPLEPYDNGDNDDDSPVITTNLERFARDQIVALIDRRFRGHELERLVEAILKAQGYTVFRSPAGSDRGVDILAASGPLGFGSPKICVQVKSSDNPVDSPTLEQLIGAMQNVQAEQGLLVSWGGFKSSVNKEIPTQFFKVRLWNQDDLIDELMSNYDNLDPDIRAQLPLKRIWAITSPKE